MTTAALVSVMIDTQLQLFLQVQSALQQCDSEIQEVVAEMIAIYTSEDATKEEKTAAMYTIRDAIFPSLAEDLRDLERPQLKSLAAQKLQAEFEVQNCTFADNLRSAMSKNQMTQEELAKKTGVSQPAISLMLNRESRPQQKTVGRFAEALGIDPSELWPMQ